MRPVSLRIKIIVPLICTFLVLLGSFIYTSYNIRRHDISHLLNMHHQEALTHFNAILDSKSDWMRATAEQISMNHNIYHAFLTKNRAQLYQSTLPYFKQLAPQGVTHIYFHDHNGINFLRVNEPHKYGDQIMRTSLMHSIQTGAPTQGFELGSYGTLALRLVFPLKDQTGTIGYLELGIEGELLLKYLADHNHVDYVLALDKHLLNRSSWEAGLNRFGRRHDWTRYQTEVVISQSLHPLPKEINVVFNNSDMNQHPHDSMWLKAKQGARHLAFKSFPLKESNGHEIGRFILIYDVSSQITYGNQKNFKELLLGLFFCLTLSSFAWLVLGRVESTILHTQHELSGKVTTISEVNKQLEYEIAERERAEKALSELNNSLEEVVRDRTSHLEQLSIELDNRQQELETTYVELKSRQAKILHQDKVASIGLLAAGVAHDINNPIGFVINNLEELNLFLKRLQSFIEFQTKLIQTSVSNEQLTVMYQERKKQKIDSIFDDFGTLIAECMEGAHRISSIVKNLRNFSRIDDDDYSYANINDCLESAIRITQHEWRNKAVVHCNFGQLPLLYCCPQQLNQVMMNLLINAAHAIEKRGEIIIKSWFDTKAIMVSISDTGSGITNEILPKIFEPFFTTKDPNRGTGLGLSIVADIIKEHNGTIEVTSTAGIGTTFIIKLPMLQPQDHHA